MNNSLFPQKARQTKVVERDEAKIAAIDARDLIVSKIKLRSRVAQCYSALKLCKKALARDFETVSESDLTSSMTEEELAEYNKFKTWLDESLDVFEK